MSRIQITFGWVILLPPNCSLAGLAPVLRGGARAAGRQEGLEERRVDVVDHVDKEKRKGVGSGGEAAKSKRRRSAGDRRLEASARGGRGIRPREAPLQDAAAGGRAEVAAGRKDQGWTEVAGSLIQPELIARSTFRLQYGMKSSSGRLQFRFNAV